MSGEQPVALSGMITYPAADMAATARFFRDVLGLTVEFADGERFTMLRAGDARVALTGADEDVAAGVPAVAVKVADVDACVDAAARLGSRIVRAPSDGPHERRAVIADPAGQAVVVYQSLPSSA